MPAHPRAWPPRPPHAHVRGMTPAGPAVLPEQADGVAHPRPAPAAARKPEPGRTLAADHYVPRAGLLLVLSPATARPAPFAPLPQAHAEAAMAPCGLFPYC